MIYHFQILDPDLPTKRCFLKVLDKQIFFSYQRTMIRFDINILYSKFYFVVPKVRIRSVCALTK